MNHHEEKLISNMITTFKSLMERYNYEKIVIDANSMMIEKNGGIKQFIPIQDN